MSKPLTNDQHIVLEATNSHGDTYVLAQAENYFITWAVTIHRYSFWGHYFSQTIDGLIDAIRDFRHRVGA